MNLKLLVLAMVLSIVNAAGFCNSNSENLLITEPMKFILHDETQVFAKPHGRGYFNSTKQDFRDNYFYYVAKSSLLLDQQDGFLKNSEFYKERATNWHESGMSGNGIMVGIPASNSIDLNIDALYFFETTENIYLLVNVTFQKEKVIFGYQKNYRSHQHHGHHYYRWNDSVISFEIEVPLENHSQFDFEKEIQNMRDAKYLHLEITKE
jgi:hypothetical protein